VSGRTPETLEQREHRYDREATTATHRREQAKAGLGHKFQAPTTVPVMDPEWADNEPRLGEVCGSVAGHFTPCTLPRGHEGAHQR
jgi:hypothetical protein